MAPPARTRPGTGELRQILTLLLGNSGPALADSLLERFGSVSALMEAEEAELSRDLGEAAVAAQVLAAARRLFRAGLAEEFERHPLSGDEEALQTYVLSRLRGLRQEVLLAFFADANRGFLTVEEIARGGRCGVSLDARTIFSRALSLDARTILLAHNHPSGVASPSPLDISATRAMSRQAAALQIGIIDHLIVGGPVVYSMRRGGHLQ